MHTITALYDATVAYVRRAGPPHASAHRSYLWLVDLDAPPRLPWWLRPFARFDGRDHFAPGGRASIRAKLDAWLAGRGIDLRGGRVLMLAGARSLGHAFSPITVFWCHGPDGALACVVAEVHDTRRGRHAYLLRPGAGERFAVSPFPAMDGEYRMHLPNPESLLAVTVASEQEDRTPFVATLRGVRRPVTRWWLVRTVLARPSLPHRPARGDGIGARITAGTPRNAGGQLDG
ncbi:DUF1365 domain-containing protein [Amycolatopsis sp. NPDC059027]|uniref:DUF1365 domain-containing protein n=1 Tax=unclassified Amycolatopsis TaxID=2618356 RepID=UPI00366C61E2